MVVFLDTVGRVSGILEEESRKFSSFQNSFGLRAFLLLVF